MDYPNLVDFKNSKTYIPDLCNFLDNLIEKSTNWIGQDIYNVVNSEAMTTKDVVDQLNQMNEGNWKKLTPNWVPIEDLNIIAPRSNCVLDNTKALGIYPLHTETEILNMVCNFNNGVEEA
jgi:hypothetical protein